MTVAVTLNAALKAITAMLLWGFSSASVAQTASTPADVAASYGPIAVCVGNYAVIVREGEAARRITLDSGRVEHVTLINSSARSVTFRTGAVETAGRTFTTERYLCRLARMSLIGETTPLLRALSH